MNDTDNGQLNITKDDIHKDVAKIFESILKDSIKLLDEIKRQNETEALMIESITSEMFADKDNPPDVKKILSIFYNIGLLIQVTGFYDEMLQTFIKDRFSYRSKMILVKSVAEIMQSKKDTTKKEGMQILYDLYHVYKPEYSAIIIYGRFIGEMLPSKEKAMLKKVYGSAIKKRTTTKRKK